MPIATGSEIYSLYLYTDDETPFSFSAQWCRARVFGSEEWAFFDNFNFEQVWVEENTPYVQFEVMVEWKLDEDDSEEEWKKPIVSRITDRLATITIQLDKVVAVRQIYYNEGEEIPPFRTED